MIRSTLLALAALVSFPAMAAYSSTQFKLYVARQNIHDAHEYEVADAGPIPVRYDDEGTCFAVGKAGDYKCQFVYPSINNPTGNPFAIYLPMSEMGRFLANELTWVKPEFRAEFLRSLPNGANDGVSFQAPESEHNNLHPANVSVQHFDSKTPDFKTTYTLE